MIGVFLEKSEEDLERNEDHIDTRGDPGEKGCPHDETHRDGF